MNFQWNTVLAPDETIQKEFTISERYRNAVVALTIVVAVVVGTAVWYVGILTLLIGILYWYYLKKAKHYAFTDKRAVLVESFIGMSVTSIDYNQITDIEVTQSLF